MRRLVIILAIFAISFVAVLVYGAGRNGTGGHKANEDSCGGAPKTNEDGSVDEDAVKKWCPPDLMKKFDGITWRFSKGIKIDRPQVSLPGNEIGDTRAVPPVKDDAPPRVAKLELTSGSAAKITASQVGKKDQMLCLCRPGNQIDSFSMAFLTKEPACSDHWLSDQAKICQPDAGHGKLTFDPLGGTIKYTSATPAVVTAK